MKFQNVQLRYDCDSRLYLVASQIHSLKYKSHMDNFPHGTDNIAVKEGHIMYLINAVLFFHFFNEVSHAWCTTIKGSFYECSLQ